MPSYFNIPYAFNQAILKFPEETKGLISIIVPMYNTNELYLKEALNSIAAQTIENWEAILIDDGSTDKTVEKICAEYAEKDSRFKYVHKSNEGTLLARKTGLENAKGEFIANLDHDDTYNPQFLEKMFAKIKERNYDFVWCDSNINKCNNEFNQSKLENCRKYIDFGIPTWNKLIKRNIYAKVLFPQIYILGQEDHIQLLQVIYHSELAAYVPDVFFHWRRGHASASSKPENGILRKNLSANNSRGAVAIYILMEQLFNASEAEKHVLFIEAFKHYFFLGKEDIAHYKIEYAENFIPAFLRGVKKSRKLKFFKKIALILACKGFALPFRFVYS
jgi:glycosyltransferase involved in cell wall biosynthesis